MQRVRVGDQVVVVSGNHKGKRGRVSQVLVERNAVIVEGVNLVKRHVKATPQQQGGIVEKPAPLDLSKVMLLDPESGKPTRVRFEVRDGEKVRVAKSGAVITAEQG
ncbi:MAG: 50S ribosomal protein L24 [Myxococcales bacterium]|jgi:large subunit ribosomal protein L24|nr:50S ribosomal protein L24 [Myxococcales bacterium]